MKVLRLIASLGFPFLAACDHIEAVGDKVNELKDVPTESTEREGDAASGAQSDPEQGIAETPQKSSGVDASLERGLRPTNPTNPTSGSSGKPIEEALKPMKKEWLPPGMSQKK